jgi:hypothetical protein
VLRAARRERPLVDPDAAESYLALLRRAFEDRGQLRRLLPWRTVRRLAHEHGFSPDATARDLDARQWAALASVRSGR